MQILVGFLAMWEQLGMRVSVFPTPAVSDVPSPKMGLKTKPVLRAVKRRAQWWSTAGSTLWWTRVASPATDWSETSTMPELLLSPPTSPLSRGASGPWPWLSSYQMSSPPPREHSTHFKNIKQMPHNPSDSFERKSDTNQHRSIVWVFYDSHLPVRTTDLPFNWVRHFFLLDLDYFQTSVRQFSSLN